MRRSNWTPFIVPRRQDQTVYLVLNDFGRQGRACCETDTERTDFEAVLSDLMAGQYKGPITVAAFNLRERWADDVSEDVALEIGRRGGGRPEELLPSIADFVERHAGREVPTRTEACISCERLSPLPWHRMGLRGPP